MTLKTDEQWIEHFMKRFTKEEINIFIEEYILQETDCPCEALDWSCDECQYPLLAGTQCEASYEWYKQVLHPRKTKLIDLIHLANKKR